MGSNETVSIFNEATKQYAVVSRFIFEHPVYGAGMIAVDANGVPCVECGEKAEEKPAKNSEKPAKSTKEGSDK